MRIYSHIGIPIVLFLLFSLCTSCNNDNGQKQADNNSKPTPAIQHLDLPTFNADSAYSDVRTQVMFGPRVPGTDAQQQCATWMGKRLKAVCDTVYIQDVQVTGGDKKLLPCINLVGVINPHATKRILFLTHWDSRPWADQDTKDTDKPILAADDGGSGVAVLLEVARQIKAKGLSLDLGIDILLTDVEDYGKRQWGENSYCLGTQYWARHPHIAGYKAEFGVLLDMVGAQGAQFPLEGFSEQYAGGVQQKVWQAANNSGFSSYFQFKESADITDDHVPVNRIIGIKTIDIINLTNDEHNIFAPHWHTHSDNMDIIDKNTLNAVGQTLIRVIYEAAQPGA